MNTIDITGRCALSAAVLRASDSPLLSGFSAPAHPSRTGMMTSSFSAPLRMGCKRKGRLHSCSVDVTDADAVNRQSLRPRKLSAESTF